MLIKIMLSMPSTISSAASMKKAIQMFGSESSSIQKPCVSEGGSLMWASGFYRQIRLGVPINSEGIRFFYGVWAAAKAITVSSGRGRQPGAMGCQPRCTTMCFGV